MPMPSTVRLRPLPLASRSAQPSFVVVAHDEPLHMAELAGDLRQSGHVEDAWTEHLATGGRTVEVTGDWASVGRAFASLGLDAELDPRPAAIGGLRCWYCLLEPPTEAPRGRPACHACASALREEGPSVESVRREAALPVRAAS
jgi:hypothetical protein